MWYVKVEGIHSNTDFKMNNICNPKIDTIIGTNDPDDLIVRAFKAYEVTKEEDGKKGIEAEMFKHALTHFGDVFNKAEVDDVFNEFEVDDDGYIESKVVIGLFVAGGGEEKKEEEKKEKTPTPEPEEAPADGKKTDYQKNTLFHWTGLLVPLSYIN